MKYLVQVNRIYLVSIDADSALRAEHAFLDLDGIQFAHAFDAEATKTETFRGVMLQCSTVSVDEIATMSRVYGDKWREYGKAKEAADAAAAEERRLHEALDKAIALRKETAGKALNALNAAKMWQTSIMGLQPEDVR